MRLVKLNSLKHDGTPHGEVHIYPERGILISTSAHAESGSENTWLTVNGESFIVQGTPAEVARLLAGGDKSADRQLFDALTMVEDLTAEVERLKGDRDGAYAILADAATAFSAEDQERLRLNLVDRYATSRAFTLNREVQEEIAALKRERDEARAAQRPVDLDAFVSVLERPDSGGWEVWIGSELSDVYPASNPSGASNRAEELRRSLGHWFDCNAVPTMFSPAPEPEETDEPALMGECPACGQPAPTSEFGVVEHLDGCGWCGHPSSNGDGSGGFFCTICNADINDEPAGEAGDEGGAA